MIRLLIIGRPSAAWAERLNQVTHQSLEIDTARLPSAGIRQFETIPADLIIIADDRGGSRVETLVHAIQKRPLGQLTPLLLICPLPTDHPVEERVEALELAGWLSSESSPASVISLIESALDVELADSEKPGAPSVDKPADEPAAKPSESASYFDGDVVLEPIDDTPKPRRVDRSSIFRTPATFSDGAPLDADEIRRKLKAVRHEDYYAILELRRGAESQTVREAFHKLRARFDAASLDFELAHKFQDELDEIRDAFDDAFAVLGDPDLREPYLRHTVK